MKDSPGGQPPSLANVFGAPKPAPLDATIKRVATNLGGAVLTLAVCAVVVLLVIKLGFWVFS